MNEGFV